MIKISLDKWIFNTEKISLVWFSDGPSWNCWVKLRQMFHFYFLHHKVWKWVFWLSGMYDLIYLVISGFESRWRKFLDGTDFFLGTTFLKISRDIIHGLHILGYYPDVAYPRIFILTLHPKYPWIISKDIYPWILSEDCVFLPLCFMGLQHVPGHILIVHMILLTTLNILSE